MTAPEYGTLTLTVDDAPAETFWRLTPLWVSACRIEGGIIWMAWGLN